MSEITELILDGFICEVCCAVFDDHETPGHPRTCEDCLEEEDYP